MRWLRRVPPFTSVYLAILVATTAVLLGLSARQADRVLLSRSTNLHQLAHDPLRVLVASAFWLSSAWQLPLVAALFLALLLPVERRIGSLRTAGAFAAGHVGATLVVAGGLWLALSLDAVDRSVVHARDVGVSYGLVAVAGVLAYLLDRRLRVPFLVAIGGLLTVTLAISPSFTNWGHLVALLIGLACYRLARPGTFTSGSQLPRVSRSGMTRTARVLWGLLPLGGVAAAAAIAAGFAFGRTAVSPQTAGVVVVRTNLAYQNAAAAGTGIVLTPAGEVLTNNHVIRGATTIRVVVPGSGRSYRAQVLGYSVTADVALIKVAASSLQTASLGDSTKIRLGQAVTAVGNAGGTGSLTAAAGSITGLGRTITAADDQGGSERLSGLIETDAGLQPGDSGGPLLDAANRVIGIDTAASAGFVFQSAPQGGFAIPIGRALTIAKQIAAGHASATVHVGRTAFLGVRVQSSDGYGGGAVITGVVSGSPADNAGLQPGDVITGLDGQTVDGPTTLTSLLLRDAPGTTVQLTLDDGLGNEQTASVTLASGPPQ